MAQDATPVIPIPTTPPAYDVAISCLRDDQHLAERLARLLGRTLSVYFLPRLQDSLTGSRYAENLRLPYVDDSRVIVVLHRAQWGSTDWTANEKSAIILRCETLGWNHLILIQLGDMARYPDWIPSSAEPLITRYDDIDQLVEIIVARVRDLRSATATSENADQSERMSDASDWRRKRRAQIEGQVWIRESLCPSVHRIVHRAAKLAMLRGKALSPFIKAAADELSCIMTNGFYGVVIAWNQGAPEMRGADTSLFIREFRGRLLVPGEGGICGPIPELLHEELFCPDIVEGQLVQWQRCDTHEAISEEGLSELAVTAFFSLLDQQRWS